MTMARFMVRPRVRYRVKPWARAQVRFMITFIAMVKVSVPSCLGV